MITTVRIVGTTVLSILVIFSIFSNLLVLMVLIKGRLQLKNFSFFTIAWQLLISDFISSPSLILVAIPSLIADRPIYEERLTIVFSTFNRVSYRALNIFTTLLALNRAFSIFFPFINKSILSSSGLAKIIVVMWIFLFIYGVLCATIGCYNSFDAVERFAFYRLCPSDTPAILVNIEMVIQWYYTYIPYIILLVYLSIFIEVKFKICKRLKYGYSSSSPTKAEYLILIQSVLLCGILAFENLAFSSLPHLNFSETLKLWTNMISLWMMVILNCTHSVILLIFNKNIRELLKNIVRQKNTSQVSFISQKPAITVNVKTTK